MIKKGIIWDFIGKLATNGVTFFVSIVLARILFPEDFAMIAMVMAFFSIAQVFIDFGLSEALIQKIDIEEIELSSIFWINVLLALSIFLIFFFSADLIAHYYGKDELYDLTRALSFTFILNALGGVHRAQLGRAMDFKSLSKINILSSFISGGFGVGFAYLGYGVLEPYHTVLCSKSYHTIFIMEEIKMDS